MAPRITFHRASTCPNRRPGGLWHRIRRHAGRSVRDDLLSVTDNGANKAKLLAAGTGELGLLG